MNDTKENNPAAKFVQYEPTIVRLTKDDTDVINTNQSVLQENDALFHWFNDQAYAYETSDEDNVGDTSSLIAQIILGVALNSSPDEPEPANQLELHSVPTWTRFRDNTIFLKSSATSTIYRLRKIVRRMAIEKNVVFLDASNYMCDNNSSSIENDFDEFMSLANNTKKVIEDAVCEDYKHNTREAIEFLNAQPTDIVKGSMDNYYPTKWLVEGQYLANQLVKIDSFKTNFNVLVIGGAHRYLMNDQLNVNNIYRLLARLGRVNTQLVFLG